MTTTKKILLWSGVAFATLLILIGLIADGPTSDTRAAAPETTAERQTPSAPTSGVTYANFQRLQEGMSYADVVTILGSEGIEISRSDLAGTTTVMYQWEGRSMANMNVMFQNGKLITKAQFGLK